MEQIFDSLLTHTNARDTKKYLLKPLSVYNFFKENDIRKIPDYQRPYSWSKENINDLLEDIQKIANGERDSWFLGPLFTTKINEHDTESSLLDGQQRITTIQIILREASLITKRIEGLDLSEDPTLKTKTEALKEQCLNSIRFYYQGENLTLKFKTESSIINLFNNYITEFEDADFNSYQGKVQTFNQQAEQEARQGSKTSRTLMASQEIISSFLSDNFILSDTIDGIKKLNKFLKSLLHKCWIIEVPLFQEDSSIQIFESLNNRGKSLTLSDKLRYKCLINCKNDEEYREHLKMQWKKIYSGLDKCIENGYIKDEEDFFKILFNTIKMQSISRQDQMIRLFEDRYINQNDENDENSGIKEFVNQSLTILHFYENVFAKNLGDEHNDFVNQFQTHEKSKIKALIQLAKKGTKFSDNSRFLLFAIILRNYSIEDYESKYILAQEIWVLCRIIFIKECLQNKKSNAIRTEILDIISVNHNSWNLQSFFHSKKDDDFSINKTLINDVLTQNNNNEAAFIIYLYCYLNEHESLQFANQAQYTHEHLEHFFPRSWKEHWLEKKYKKEDIDLFVEQKLDSTKYEKLKIDENNKMYIINEIKNKESLELFNDDTKQNDTLLQFIGNKWVIHAGENIQASNKGFTEKKKKYGAGMYIKLPSNQNTDIGLDSYENFTYKEIITRSLEIVDGIFKKFYHTWEDIE
tara:strand:- start:965 stop:3049 length:2085 start_codon:yes stop_codon:yes gene_type:complete